MLDEAKNAAEFNDYLRNVVYKFYTQTNLPVPKPEFIIRGYWTIVSHKLQPWPKVLGTAGLSQPSGRHKGWKWPNWSDHFVSSKGRGYQNDFTDLSRSEDGYP